MINAEPRPPLSTQLLRLVLRWLITTLAIFVAVWLVPGIDFAGPGWQLGLVAAIFGLVNALIRPLLALLTCSLVLLTLGLFMLVINAGMLLLTAWIAGQLGVQFRVDGFWPALLGSLLISLVSLLLSILAGEQPVRVVVVRERNDRR
jgi:putative membrane protein